MQQDDYFGLCPTCKKTDGCINIGRSHWYYCKKHKVKWCVGSNLFSYWRDQTEAKQRKIFDRLKFGSFKEIEEFHLPSTPREELPEDEISF